MSLVRGSGDLRRTAGVFVTTGNANDQTRFGVLLLRQGGTAWDMSGFTANGAGMASVTTLPSEAESYPITLPGFVSMVSSQTSSYARTLVLPVGGAPPVATLRWRRPTGPLLDPTGTGENFHADVGTNLAPLHHASVLGPRSGSNGAIGTRTFIVGVSNGSLVVRYGTYSELSPVPHIATITPIGMIMPGHVTSAGVESADGSTAELLVLAAPPGGPSLAALVRTLPATPFIESVALGGDLATFSPMIEPQQVNGRAAGLARSGSTRVAFAIEGCTNPPASRRPVVFTFPSSGATPMASRRLPEAACEIMLDVRWHVEQVNDSEAWVLLTHGGAGMPPGRRSARLYHVNNGTVDGPVDLVETGSVTGLGMSRTSPPNPILCNVDSPTAPAPEVVTCWELLQ